MTSASGQTVTSVSGKLPLDRTKYHALFDSIVCEGIKCDILFMVIKNRLGEEPDYVKKLRNVFVFNILKEGKLACTWTVDTKKCLEGDVYRSEPRGVKADVVLSVEDEDWVKIMVGKLNPQRAFMMGKFRIKGNIMLLQKLHSLWYDLRKNGRAPELDVFQDVMVSETIIPGLRSEVMSIEFVTRIVRIEQVCEKINSIIQLNINKDGRLVTIYSFDAKAGSEVAFRRGEAPVKPDVTFTIEDDDLILLLFKHINYDEAVASGIVLVEGDMEAVARTKILFDVPVQNAKL